MRVLMTIGFLFLAIRPTLGVAGEFVAFAQGAENSVSDVSARIRPILFNALDSRPHCDVRTRAGPHTPENRCEGAHQLREWLSELCRSLGEGCKAYRHDLPEVDCDCTGRTDDRLSEITARHDIPLELPEIVRTSQELSVEWSWPEPPVLGSIWARVREWYPPAPSFKISTLVALLLTRAIR
jgi:hypothetical protein